MAYLLDDVAGGVGGAVITPTAGQTYGGGGTVTPEVGTWIPSGGKFLEVTDSGWIGRDFLASGKSATNYAEGTILSGQGGAEYEVGKTGLMVHSNNPNEAAFAKDFGTQLAEAGESGSDWAPLLEGAHIQALADKHNISLDKGLSLARGMYGLKKMGAEANALDWSITRDQYQLGMQVAGMGMALYDKILQNMYMNHRMDLENDMMTLAEDKETNRHELQMTLLEKESTLKDTAMKYDYKTAKLNAGTEKYKAKLAADVKRSKIKQEGIRDLFFRNQYPYGNAHYV